MQRFAFFVLLLLTLTESASVESVQSESDLLSSIDIIVFEHSLKASRHWDCLRVGDHAARAEEARIWQAVIPDARIEEIVVAPGNRILQTGEQYKWINENVHSSGSFMQSSALLGMRKPDFDGSTAVTKVLHSKSKQVNKDVLSVMLPQLEQSKKRILEWIARNNHDAPPVNLLQLGKSADDLMKCMVRSQTFFSSSCMASKITDSLLNRRFLVPRAANYHPRVFKHPYFTTGDLVAGMALTAESRKKGHADAFKLFKLMVQSFLPGFNVSLGAVPTSSAGKPARTVYLHRSFRYVPAGADLAFYFDGNRGRFLRIFNDSIVLNRPEGIVDGQHHAALVLSFDVNADDSSLATHPTKANITMREVFCKELERALAVYVPSGATDDKVQAISVATILSRAARLERNSFLEAQRKVLESKPTLLAELLLAKLVRLVIDYFNDDAYPFIVSTHRWLLQNEPEIAVDGARLYVVIRSEGIKGLSHSSARLREDRRRCIDFCNPQWSAYREFASSHDGRHVYFGHKYKASTDLGEQTESDAIWLTQDNGLKDGRFKRVAFDGKNSSYGLLSRDGKTLLSCIILTDAARVYQIKKEAGRDPVAVMKFSLTGKPRAISGNGNRVVIRNAGQLEIHDIGKDASVLLYRMDVFGCVCALNEDGSEAAFVTDSDELWILSLDKVAEGTAEQSAIVALKVPESFGVIHKLVYSDENRLHVLHNEGSVSLFDPLRKALVLIEASKGGQRIADWAISPDADYVATIRCVGKEENAGRRIYTTIVKRKLRNADLRDLFGYKDDTAASNF